MNILIIAVLVILILLALLVKLSLKNKKYEAKYSNAISADEELERLKELFKSKKAIYDDLVKQVAIYNDELELAEWGFYKPIFDFGTSEEYKNAIQDVRDKQKAMISDNTAIYCNTEWTVEGSKVKGRTMTNRQIRLTARAFNNECDAAIAKVKWNNVQKMSERIGKAYEALNKLNESSHVYISSEYFNLKIDELTLAYEYEDKKQKEKEEQAAIREQMREEAKFVKEAEEAAMEEEKYQKLLDKAQKEAEKATGDKLDTMNERIKQLQEELATAHEKNQRAKSMAEQTRSGHVYVISNVGSFGENVYKIGMTRRLEPLDRVKELGDASVPFIFDVHAMIYSEDAPAMEKKLHNVFDRQRVNLVNNKKEFFNVSLQDIENEAKKISPAAQFIKTIEAREYKETVSIREKNESGNKVVNTTNRFPREL